MGEAYSTCRRFYLCFAVDRVGVVMEKEEIKYKIYLDVCCLNRPFDDWIQERIRLEGEAVISIMEKIKAKKWQLVTSEAVTAELEKMRNLEN